MYLFTLVCSFVHLPVYMRCIEAMRSNEAEVLLKLVQDVFFVSVIFNSESLHKKIANKCIMILRPAGERQHLLLNSPILFLYLRVTSLSSEHSP